MVNLLNKIKENNITIYDFKDLNICGELGEGANGTVYRCNIFNKRYAVKKLHQTNIKSKSNYLLNEILNEIDIGQKLNSKRIMKIYGMSYNEEKKEVYIILELLNNKGCLFDYLYKMNNNFNKYEKITLFLSIVKAVRDLHENNYCHADLKPENLVYYYDLREKTKYIKLIDFDRVAKISEGDNYINFTRGTYGYCAPEQHIKDKYLCLKSDIYSLGVIFLEILYEYELWDPQYYNYQKYRLSILEKLEEIKNDDLIINKIINKCLSKSPGKRYDINELYNEILVLKNVNYYHNDRK